MHALQVSSIRTCRTGRITLAPRGPTPARQALLLALLAQSASSARRRQEPRHAATARWRSTPGPPRAHQVHYKQTTPGMSMMRHCGEIVFIA